MPKVKKKGAKDKGGANGTGGRQRSKKQTILEALRGTSAAQPEGDDGEDTPIESLADLRTWLSGELDRREAARDERSAAETERFAGVIEERFGSIENAFEALDDEDERLDESIVDDDEQLDIDLDPEQVRNFRLGLAIVGHRNGWQGTFRELPERQMVEAATVRAQSSGVDTAGGFLVPGQFMQDRIIGPLEAESILFLLGATSLTGLTGEPVEIPREEGTPTASWAGENTKPADTSVTYGQLRMVPHRLTSWVKISNRLLRQTAGRAQSLVTRRLVKALRLKLDIAGFKGTGASGEPVGVSVQPNVGSFDWDAVAPNYGSAQNITDKLESMIGKIEDKDAWAGADRPGWAMSPAVRRKLKSTKDADGKPIFFSTIIQGNAQSGAVVGGGLGINARLFFDLPFFTSSQLAGGADGDLILGDWARLLVGQWQDMILDSNDRFEDVWRADQTAVKVQMEVDIGVEHPEAFCITTDLDTA